MKNQPIPSDSDPLENDEGNVLDHSTQLDKHLWSEFPEVNKFIGEIYVNHFSDHMSNIQKKHLKVVLLHLYVTWVSDPTLYTAVHLNERKYKAKSRYNSLFISRLTIPIVKELRDLSLVEYHEGFYD